MDNKTPRPIVDLRQEFLFIFGVLALAAAILAGVAYSRPLTMEVASDIGYLHQGDFNYTSDEKALIYNSATIKTGDPVYTKLTCEVTMDFEYAFTSRKMSDLDREKFTGIYQVGILLSDIDGWNRSYQLVPETAFSGTNFSTQLDLDICDMQTLIRDKEEKTGVESRVYDLFILPTVSIAGTISGISVKDIYEPNILFQIDASLMRLPDKEESLVLDQEGSISVKRIKSNLMLIFGRYYQIQEVRNVAVILFAAAFLGSIYPAYSIVRDWRESDSTRISIQHQPLLIDIKLGSLLVKGVTVIEVDTFADLSKMAERYGAMILHETGEDFHRYTVQDGQTHFQYTLESLPTPEDGKKK